MVSAAHAQNLAVVGAQASRSSDYAYAAVLMPIGQSRLGDGYYLSPDIGVSRYIFNQDHTGFTGVQPSVTLGLGYATTLAGTSLSLSIAGGYAHTNLTPYALPGSLQGNSVFAEPQIWLQVPLPTRVKLTANGGYLLGLRSYWFLTYAAIPVAGTFSLGPEIDLGGGSNYRNEVFALRGNANITPQLGASLTLGAIADSAGEYDPYVGFTLNYPLP